MDGPSHLAVHPIASPPWMPRRRRASARLRAALLLACASVAAIATASATTPATAPAADAPGPMAEMLGRIVADTVLQHVAETAYDRTAAWRCTPDVEALARGAQASLEADFTPEQRLRLDIMATTPGARRIEARARNARLQAMGEAPEPLADGDPKDVEALAAFGASPLGKQFDDWLRGMNDRDDAPMAMAADAAERTCLLQQGR